VPNKKIRVLWGENTETRLAQKKSATRGCIGKDKIGREAFYRKESKRLHSRNGFRVNGQLTTLQRGMKPRSLQEEKSGWFNGDTRRKEIRIKTA